MSEINSDVTPEAPAEAEARVLLTAEELETPLTDGLLELAKIQAERETPEHKNMLALIEALTNHVKAVDQREAEVKAELSALLTANAPNPTDKGSYPIPPKLAGFITPRQREEWAYDDKKALQLVQDQELSEYFRVTVALNKTPFKKYLDRAPDEFIQATGARKEASVVLAFDNLASFVPLRDRANEIDKLMRAMEALDDQAEADPAEDHGE